MDEALPLAKGLFLNLTIMVGLVAGLSLLRDFFRRSHRPYEPWAFGAAAALATLATMLTGAQLGDGFVMDSRIAPLSLAGLAGGPVAGAVAAVPALLFRWQMGGAGLGAGLGEILGAVASGILYRAWRLRGRREFSKEHVFGFACIATLATLLASAAGYAASPAAGTVTQNASYIFVITPFMLAATWLLARLWVLDQERSGLAMRLSDAKARYRMFLEQSQEAVWVWEVTPPVSLDEPLEAILESIGTRLTLVEANQRAADMMGWANAPAMLGKALPALVEKPRRIVERLARGFFEAGAHYHERKVAVPGRAARPPRQYLYRAQGVVEGGRLSMIWATLRDITDEAAVERRALAAERQLEEAQKMETVGTLASGVAHDFKNILAPIQGQADLLAQRVTDGQDRLAVETIQRAAARGAGLVRQMLAYARKDLGYPEPLLVAEVVNESLMIVGTGIPSRVTVLRQFDGGVPAVLADRARLEQVVMNLIQNAADAMRDGGGRLNLGVSLARDGRVLLVVEDTGPGMDEATRRRAFEPFFTTKEKTKGTGLGLYVAHGIVRDLGGTLKLESRPGKGARFEVLLPPSQARPAARRREERMVLGSGEHILFVDDDEDVRETIGGMLRQLGYRVSVRESVDTALEFLRTKEGRVRLVITDLGMPGRNGLDLAREVRDHWPEVPLMILTGDGEGPRENFSAAGAALTLEKPVGLVELSRTVAALMGKT